MEKVSKTCILRAALLVSAAFLFSATDAAFAAPSEVQKAIKEAESLSLVQDRNMACNVLIRAIKRAKPSEAKTLKAKLGELAKYFYTDKGFQAYLSGKELFEKKKYADAIDKFVESDELEKSNTDVLELLSLAQFDSGKFAPSQSSAEKGLQVNPYNLEFVRTELAALVAQEKWVEGGKVADQLLKDFGDSTAQVLTAKGLSILKTAETPAEAENWFAQAISRDPKYPEAYYWLSNIKEAPISSKLLTKYAELCKNKAAVKYDREPALCSKLSEVEGKLKPPH